MKLSSIISIASSAILVSAVPTETTQSGLIRAHNSPNMLRRFLSQPRETIDINYKDAKYGMNILHWAAEAGANEVIKLLLEDGRIELGATADYDGSSALHFATKSCHTRTVIALAEAGLDVNAQDNMGKPAWIYSISCNDGLDVIMEPNFDVSAWDYLLKKSKNIDWSFKSKTGGTILFELERISDLMPVQMQLARVFQTAKLAITRGNVDPNATNKDGLNFLLDYLKDPFHSTYMESAFALLLKSGLLTGFNVDAKSPKDGMTALMYCAMNPKNSLPLVKALVELGADKSLKNNQGLNAYDIAKAKNASSEIINLLK